MDIETKFLKSIKCIRDDRHKLGRKTLIARISDTVNSANFVRGSKFRHPNGEFLLSPARSISPDITIFQKHTLL
jgi:hypothetical protein